MQINLHRGRGVISKLILWQTRGKFSHASVTLADGRVVESREFIGVHVVPKLEARDGEIIEIYEVATTPEQEKIITEFLIAQLGKKYDYAAILLFITRKDIPHWDKVKWFCSELVFQSFKQAGIELLQNIQAWAVSPELIGISPAKSFVRRIKG